VCECGRNVINSINNAHKNIICRKFNSGIDHYSIVCIIGFTTQSIGNNQMTTIIVRRTSNYGKTAIYPVCIIAEKFAKIAGTKTLTDETIKIIKEMGIQIELEQERI